MRGRGRRPVLLIGLALVMVMGIAVYSRLWVIDYRISSDEAELLRRQFDSASREAMEESAEWRQRYDEEVVRSRNCAAELIELKKSLKMKVEDARKLEMLQKENMNLLQRLESLRRELEEPLATRSQPTVTESLATSSQPTELMATSSQPTETVFSMSARNQRDGLRHG